MDLIDHFYDIEHLLENFSSLQELNIKREYKESELKCLQKPELLSQSDMYSKFKSLQLRSVNLEKLNFEVKSSDYRQSLRYPIRLELFVD